MHSGICLFSSSVHYFYLKLVNIPKFNVMSDLDYRNSNAKILFYHRVPSLRGDTWIAM